MDKASLRLKYRNLRQELSVEEQERRSLAIANNILKLDIWDREFYHIFLTIPRLNEVNTDYILSILSGKDKHIIVSRSDFEKGTLTHFLLTDNTVIKPNAWGIPEPQNGIPVAESQIEVIFLPLLAFDTRGNRLGYGKGFYDRFLSKCPQNTLKIGLSYFEAEEKIPSTADDIPLTHCISANKIYIF